MREISLREYQLDAVQALREGVRSGQADELERARSALFALDPGCEHSTWARIGMAAKVARCS